MKIQPAFFPPALQLEQPVALPDRMALAQRQPATFGKQIDQQYRLVIHLETVGTYDLPE